MKHGGYDSHLSRLRQSLASYQAAAYRSLRRHLSPEYRLVRPDGGYFLWIECPRRVKALEVHRQALDFGVTIAPGPVFSPRRAFDHCIRLNTGHPWTAASEQAMERLADLLRRF